MAKQKSKDAGLSLEEIRDIIQDRDDWRGENLAREIAERCIERYLMGSDSAGGYRSSDEIAADGEREMFGYEIEDGIEAAGVGKYRGY